MPLKHFRQSSGFPEMYKTTTVKFPEIYMLSSPMTNLCFTYRCFTHVRKNLVSIIFVFTASTENGILLCVCDVITGVGRLTYLKQIDRHISCDKYHHRHSSTAGHPLLEVVTIHSPGGAAGTANLIRV